MGISKMRMLAPVVGGLFALSAAAEMSFTVDPAVDKVCEIVISDTAIPAEATAAELLMRHLPRMVTGVVFRVVRESAADARVKRISVGWTKALSSVGIDCSGWDVEEELIAVRDGRLFIAGGRPRGTRYAAADFLESLGTVVAADDTQVDPSLERIVWSRKDFRRKPAFCGPSGQSGQNGLEKVRLSMLSMQSIRSI